MQFDRCRRCLRAGSGSSGFAVVNTIALLFAATVIGPATPRVHAQDGPPPTAVRTRMASLETVQDQLPVTGEIRAVARATVASDAEGRVIEVLVTEGDRVVAGDPIARVDDTRPRLQRDRLLASRAAAEATLEVRAAELARARLDLERLVELAANRAGRPRELDDARTDVAIAVAREAEARGDIAVIAADVAIAEDALAKSIVRAPFEGTVVERRTDVGRWMERGGDVVELIGHRRFEIWLEVPQRFKAALLGPDATIGARVEAVGLGWTDVRPVVVPIVDPTSRSFRVKLTVDDEEGLLVDGMSAVGSVPAGRSAEHLLIPRDALMQNAAGAFVFSAMGGDDGAPATAIPVPVRVLFGVGDRVAVDAAGLFPGAAVVVEGNERLFPMMPVIPTPTPAPASEPVAGAESTSGSSSDQERGSVSDRNSAGASARE
ncbi:MAG: efflux RND transporter periplasmic adaptor subunit [Phycisphaerales bacterium]